MDHDEMCRAQDQKLAVLGEKISTNDRNLDSVVDKFNEFIRDRANDRLLWRTMEKDIEHIKAKVDGMQKWGSAIGLSFILAFVAAIATWIIRGGLRP